MPRIEMNDLIQGYSQLSAESINLIKWFYSRFDNRAAANQRITNVEPLYYQGVIAGTEFLTYAATKLYLCLFLFSSPSNGGAVQTALYNEANAVSSTTSDIIAYWNGAAAVYYSNTSFLYNNYFSRIVSGYTYILFNGFRITLV